MDILIENLGLILAGAAAIAFTKWMSKKSNETTDLQEEGKTVLKYPKINLWIAYGGLGLSSFIALMGILYNSETATDARGWLILPGMFLAIGAPLILTYYNSKFLFDEHEITRSNWLRQRATIRWDEVKSVKFGATSQYLTFRSDHKKIHAHFMMVGFQSLLDTMQTKLGDDMTKGALAGIKWLRENQR